MLPVPTVQKLASKKNVRDSVQRYPVRKKDEHVQDWWKEQPENKLPARRGSEVSYRAVFLSFCCRWQTLPKQVGVGWKINGVRAMWMGVCLRLKDEALM